MTELSNIKKISEFDDKSLLLVDDDNPFRERLARAMEKKGFEVIQADSVQKGVDSLKFKKPRQHLANLTCVLCVQNMSKTS